jgi:hypothetical protein
MWRFQASLLVVAVVVQLALARPSSFAVERAAFSPEMYESGEVMHMIMQEKEVRGFLNVCEA